MFFYIFIWFVIQIRSFWCDAKKVQVQVFLLTESQRWKLRMKFRNVLLLTVASSGDAVAQVNKIINAETKAINKLKHETK